MAQQLQNRPCGGRYGDIVQAIGNTPLVELKRLSPKPGVRIWAKLESHNPTGSVKDRVARALIEDAEEKGAIRPGQTILEPTSGNTGISLAMICSRKGYPLKVVMPDNVTPERTQLLQMYGAEIVYSPGDQGSNGAVAMALEMAEADASYYMPYQYGNEANPRAHYEGTAPEILEELDEISAFVAGLGTGGTLMGNGRRLREELGDAVKIVAAEPMQGEPVQGLRSLDDGFIPPIIDLSLLDRKIFVTNHDAIVWTRSCSTRRASSPASRRARSPRSPCGSPTSSTRATSSSSSATTAGSTSPPASTRGPSRRSRTWTPPSGGRTRRGLLAAGAGGLVVAGCGAPEEPPPDAELLAPSLAAALALADAYERAGGRIGRALAAREREHAERCARGRAAGARAPAAPAARRWRPRWRSSRPRCAPTCGRSGWCARCRPARSGRAAGRRRPPRPVLRGRARRARRARSRTAAMRERLAPRGARPGSPAPRARPRGAGGRAAAATRAPR